MKKAGIFLLLGGMVMILFGCGKKSYNVDYCGDQDFYENAESSYKEGEKVSLIYGVIATDTDYSFYLDDESIGYRYENGVFVVDFVMPGHDVKLECRTVNSMENTNIAITVKNQIKTADIWIISDTEENRKTTVWGTATLSELDTETCETAYISMDENGLYLIRMIDEDHMFYSADGIKLEVGQSIVIREDAKTRAAIVEIYDEDETKISEYEMFVGRL